MLLSGLHVHVDEKISFSAPPRYFQTVVILFRSCNIAVLCYAPFNTLPLLQVKKLPCIQTWVHYENSNLAQTIQQKYGQWFPTFQLMKFYKSHFKRICILL